MRTLRRSSAKLSDLCDHGRLIANHVAADDMVMTALSFGKVNQFVGYFKPTWFGFVGWTTWRLFADGERSLVESYFEANERLLRKLATCNGRSWSDLVRDAYGFEDKDASRRVVFKFRLTDEQMIQQLKSILEANDAAGAE